MSRKAFVLLLCVVGGCIGLYAVNKWLYEKDSGIFLTQNTYLGTVTWYEEGNTPPVPSEFTDHSSLLASNGKQEIFPVPEQDINKEALVNEVEGLQDVLGVTTAAPPATAPVKTPPAGVVEQKQQKEVVQTEATPVAKEEKTVRQKAIEDIVTSVPKEKSLEAITLLNNNKRPIQIRFSSPVVYKAFYLSSPERIVIDVQGKLTIADTKKLILPQNKFTKSTRVAHNNSDTRIVIDLHKKPQIWSVSYGKTKSILEVELR